MPEISLRISKSAENFNADLNGKNHFPGDAFIFQDDSYFLIMNGVNYRFTSTDPEINARACIAAYEKKGDRFFEDFRGSFAGALLDISKDKWLIFTNHTGEQPVFYTQTEEEFIIESNIFRITDHLTLKQKAYGLNEEAAYYLLTYGYLTGEQSLVKRIKKLEAGHYLKIENGKLSNSVYYQTDNTPDKKLGKHDAIEGIDYHFRGAIELEYEKDVSYSKKHFSTLSGGLDSRMCVWVANDMGYTRSTDLCFSQSGYLDMKISREISDHLEHQWLFAELDKGEHLIGQLDQLIYDTNASYHFSGASSLAKIRSFSPDGFGLVHTGLLGDAVIGTHNPENAYSGPNTVKATSRRLMHRNKDEHLDLYRNNEIAELYLRGFNGILNNSMLLQNFSQASSPFLDPDFMDFCMRVPAEDRAYHKIYKDWILKKYPESARFKWEAINAKLTDRTLRIRGKEIPLKHLGKFAVEGFFHNIGRPINNTYSKAHMNPFNYWYKTNERLRSYLTNYFEEHINLLSDGLLKEDCIEMYKKGNAIEKMQVLSLLSAVKQLGL